MLVVVLAWALQLALSRRLQAPGIDLVVPAVALAAWIAGRGAGLLAVGLSLVARALFGPGPTEGTSQAVSLGLFAAVATAAVLGVSWLRRATHAARSEAEHWRTVFDDGPAPVWEEDFSAVRRRFDALRAQGVEDLGRHLREHPEELTHLASLVRVRQVSHSSLSFFGVRRVEELPRALAEYFEADSLPVFARELEALWAGRTSFEEESPVLGPGGTRRHLGIRLSVMLGFEQSLSRVLVSFSDLTARRQAETALREAERRLRDLVEHSTNLFYMHTPDGILQYVSPQSVHYLDCPPEEARGHWTEFITDNPANAVCEERTRLAIESGQPQLPYECELRTRQGRAIWVEVHEAPVVEDGRVVAIVGSLSDVTDRKRAEEGLREADRRKDEFLGVLSHELRNPLAPIRNSLYVLRRAESLGERGEKALSVIDRQVGLLTRLIDDLLDVTRIARGKVRLHRRPVALDAVVRRAAEDRVLQFEAAGVALELDLPDHPIYAEADEARIAQVTANLLSNATKFTPRGGRVRVSLSQAGDRAILEVRDDGSGIEPDMLRQLFLPFAQADRTLDRSRGGLGLGLALVKGLVTLHGGTVEARSDGAGRGSVFTVTLPAQPAQEARSVSAPVTSLAAAKVQRRRVLIVEDNRDAADSLRQVLELDGHEVRVAASGDEGLRMALADPPEVVLCDIGLPGMDGYAVARALRGVPALDKTRLVAVTGYARPEDLRRSAEAGFDLHLAKPASPAGLARALQWTSEEGPPLEAVAVGEALPAAH